MIGLANAMKNAHAQGHISDTQIEQIHNMMLDACMGLAIAAEEDGNARDIRHADILDVFADAIEDVADAATTKRREAQKAARHQKTIDELKG